MRRKARLNVLYWPILASIFIILILIGFGPLSNRFRPTISQWWAGGDFGSKFGGWSNQESMGARSITLPWLDLASKSNHSTSTDRSDQAPPRTLVIQTEGRGLSGPRVSIDARDSFDTTDKPRAFHSPHALRSLAAHERADLAAARLMAPKRLDTEELAGLDRSPKQVMRLASESTKDYASHEELNLRNSWSAKTHVGDDLRDTTKRVAETNRRGHGLGGGWPETPQLMSELESVVWIASRKGISRFVSTSTASFSIDDWKAEVADALASLTALSSVSSEEAGPILDQLRSLAAQGHEAGEAMADRELQIKLLSAAHGIDRRVAIWSSVWRTTQGTVTRISDIDSDFDGMAIMYQETGQLIDLLSHDIASSDDPEGWHEFLMIDEIEAASQDSDAESRRLAAQRFLSRLTWYRLSDEHRTWLDRSSVRNLSLVLRRWAARPLDYSSLLGQIERQESDSIDLGGIDVASAVQTLRFAQSREANRIAESLNTHYRNANIRVAITSDFIGRMIPEVDAKVQPVRDRILGADVRGTSIVHSDLNVRLIPSENSWKLALENHGRITTGASSRQWPVLIRSNSNASFLSTTPIEVTRSDAVTGLTNVAVQSSTRVRDVESDFDSIPLVSSLVREIAMNRYESMAPVAKQIQTNKIRGGVSQEVDRKVAEQLNETSELLARRLTGPLGSLRLNPLVVDMQTTDTRLSARYRVAGDWQLAAFTPRPRAPLSSLLSVQLHQSALNNTLETILPAGEPVTIEALLEHIKEVFAIDESVPLGEDAPPANTTIQFASTRPITVEIEDGILWITMRVMRLKQDKGIDLRRFIVRAGYRPEVNGLTARLARDGHLRISGPDMSMRDRLPVRAIFNKVFSTNRTLPLIPERWSENETLTGLAVTQAELRDGWIAIAVGNASDAGPAPIVANRNVEDTDSDEF
jgi:hypothetical protein